MERYNKLKEEYDEVCTTISDKDAKYEQMGRFIKVLKGQDELITEFDESLWSSLAEKILVKAKDDVMVVFKDCTEIKAEQEEFMALRTMVLGAFCVEDRYLVEVRCFLNIKKTPRSRRTLLQL